MISHCQKHENEARSNTNDEIKRFVWEHETTSDIDVSALVLPANESSQQILDMIT
jgi:hypothetical protein